MGEPFDKPGCLSRYKGMRLRAELIDRPSLGRGALWAVVHVPAVLENNRLQRERRVR
ncbi:MAG: hypothetical protein RLZZ399_1011 [Verrucomicrobiota bacterium]|jgi:hypothetical protein